MQRRAERRAQRLATLEAQAGIVGLDPDSPRYQMRFWVQQVRRSNQATVFASALGLSSLTWWLLSARIYEVPLAASIWGGLTVLPILGGAMAMRELRRTTWLLNEEQRGARVRFARWSVRDALEANAAIERWARQRFAQ